MGKDRAEKIVKKDKKIKSKASKKKSKSKEKKFKSQGGAVLVADEDFHRVKEECFNAVQEIIDEGEPFVDNDFPMYDRETALQSIFGSDPQHDSSMLGMKNEEFYLLRITEAFPDANLEVFTDGASAHDIVQGGNGTCFYLGALMCVAEHNRFIDKLLVNYSIELGVYGVMFFSAAGNWDYVIIDDYFAINQDNELCVSKSKDENELWVSIFEKAYAKLHGSFDMIDGGFGETAIVDLTGGIPVSIDRFNWDEMHNAVQSKLYCIACALCNVEGTDQDETEDGLIPGHIYSVLNTLESGNVRLVNVRNPHGGGEWTGDYSDYSSLWTPKLKAAAQLVSADDGSFWMSHKDFSNWFELECVRLFSSEHSCSKITGESMYDFDDENEDAAFEHLYYEGFYLLTLNKAGDVAFCLTQADNTKSSDWDVKKNDLFGIGFAILEFELDVDHIPTAYQNGEYEVVHNYDDLSDVRDLAVELSLSKGTFALIPRFDYAGCEYAVRIFTDVTDFDFEYYHPDDDEGDDEGDDEEEEEEEYD